MFAAFYDFDGTRERAIRLVEGQGRNLGTDITGNNLFIERVWQMVVSEILIKLSCPTLAKCLLSTFEISLGSVERLPSGF